MARSTVNLGAKDKALEKLLKGLERRLEKDTAHMRQYQQDLRDIQELIDANKIDREHGSILAKAALKTLRTAEQKLCKREGRTFNPNYPDPPRKPANRKHDPRGFWSRCFGL